MAAQDQARAPYEQQLRDFLGPRGVDLDAQAAVFLLFRTATDVIAQAEASVLRAYGLTHAGFVLMMTLWVTGPQETRRLARFQRVSKPTIVSCVNTLERAGLVRRERSVADRRLVRVALTAKGRRLIERAQAAWHERERAIAGALTSQEQRLLASLLRRLGRAAHRNGSEEGT
jgi:DNA-binding MarR family transcriptional regulator